MFWKNTQTPLEKQIVFGYSKNNARFIENALCFPKCLRVFLRIQKFFTVRLFLPARSHSHRKTANGGLALFFFEGKQRKRAEPSPEFSAELRDAHPRRRSVRMRQNITFFVFDCAIRLLSTLFNFEVKSNPLAHFRNVFDSTPSTKVN